jgi:hypothetical protein
LISLNPAASRFMTLTPERHQLTIQELAEIMQVVMRVGVLMLKSGTVSFRVEQVMPLKRGLVSWLWSAASMQHEF